MMQSLQQVGQMAQQIGQQIAQLQQQMQALQSSMAGGYGYAQPYGYNPYGYGYYASGFGPRVVDHPMNMTVGESGPEMVYVAPMNNNRNSRTGELSPFAPMRQRFQAGTPGGLGMGGRSSALAQMFIQISQAAIIAGDTSQTSLKKIGSAIEQQAVPSVQQLGDAFQATGQQGSNAMEQIGQAILNGTIPPIEDIGLTFIDASNLVGTGANQMNNSLGSVTQGVQGLVGAIGQIPAAAQQAGSALQQLQQLQQAVGGGTGAAYQSITAPGAFPQGPIPAGWNDPSNPLIQLGQKLLGGAAGIGPAIFNRPTRLTVGESGKEMVYTSRMAAGTFGGTMPTIGGAGGVPAEFAKMFTQAADAARVASASTTRWMQQIGTSVQQEAVPAMQQLGKTFKTTGQQGSNAMLQVGQAILNGTIPPIEGIGVATIDATNLVGPSTQQMTNAFGATANFVQGSLIPTIGQGIPTSGNNAATGIGTAANYMGQSFDAVSQTVGGLINSINQIPAAAQRCSGCYRRSWRCFYSNRWWHNRNTPRIYKLWNTWRAATSSRME